MSDLADAFLGYVLEFSRPFRDIQCLYLRSTRIKLIKVTLSPGSLYRVSSPSHLHTAIGAST